MIPLVMSIIAKTETFQRDMARARGHVGKFESQVKRSNITLTGFSKSILRFAGVGGGLYLLQRQFRNVISETSRAEETTSKFNVVFGEHAKKATQWAIEFGDKVGRSTYDIQEWMAGLQDTFVPLGFARDKATELSESLTQLAVDVASFQNKADADVIRDFTSALVGNHETVRKYGIIISESAIKQEAMRKGLSKTYKELTDLEKVQIRYNLIQQGSTDAQGDAIRTADSYANQVRALSSNYSELSVTIGQELLPTMTDLIITLNDFLTTGDRAANAIGRITDAMQAYWKWYSRFMKETPGGWVLSKMYGGLAAPREKAAEEPEMMGILPENEIDILNKRLQEVYKEQADSATNTSKTTIMTTLDIARAYTRMYDSINSKSKESFDWKRKLIDEEFKVYEKNIKDKILLAEIKAERLKQLAIEEAKARGTALEGIGAALDELERDLPSIGKLFYDLTKTGTKGLVEGLNDALWKTRELDESMKQLGLTMAKMITEWLLLQAVTSAAGGIGQAFGAAIGHSEGRVGSLTSHRFVSPSVFMGAPRYHDLKPGETAVIAQDDEVISRPLPGGSAVESKLDMLISLLSERQTINATIIDSRDVVTRERIEGRDGEQWTMRHIRRNS